jgi:hypothetical protein
MRPFAILLFCVACTGNAPDRRQTPAPAAKPDGGAAPQQAPAELTIVKVARARLDAPVRFRQRVDKYRPSPPATPDPGEVTTQDVVLVVVHADDMNLLGARSQLDPIWFLDRVQATVLQVDFPRGLVVFMGPDTGPAGIAAGTLWKLDPNEEPPEQVDPTFVQRRLNEMARGTRGGHRLGAVPVAPEVIQAKDDGELLLKVRPIVKAIP